MFKFTTYPNGALTLVDFNPQEIRNHKASKGSSCVNGVAEVAQSLEKLVERASQVPISPSMLKDGKRAIVNFIETNFIILDIDEDCTLLDATQTLTASGYQFGIYTSYSHNKFGLDKFHVIVPIDRVITSEAEYKATYRHAAQTLFKNNHDEQTCSPANLFFNSNITTCQRVVVSDGMLYPKQYQAEKQQPVRQSQPQSQTTVNVKSLSRRTMVFLTSGAEDGKWHAEMILAIKNLKAAGYTKDQSIEKLEKITGELTNEDMYQIDKGYQDSSFQYDLSMLKPNHDLRQKYISDKGKMIKIPDREIVETFIKERGLLVSINEQYYLDNQIMPAQVIIEHIRDFADTSLRQEITPSKINSVLQRILFENRKKRFFEMQKSIEYDGNDFDFTQIIKAITGKEDFVDTLIIKHFLWQVKRKMWDKKVTHHIMPVLVGKSGSGKSHFIANFLAPIKDISYLDGDFKKLVDTRESFNLINNYVYFIDEMSKAEYSDVDTIKNKITSPTIQYRILGTNNTSFGSNNCTFIGASNTNIEYVIKDETSIRRFFQLTTPQKMDWAAINSIDFLSMWKAIDENQEDPYILPHLDKVAEIQQTFKHQSVVEHFIREELKGINNNEEGDRCSQTELFGKFREYRMLSGYNNGIGKHLFYEKLKILIGEPKRGRVGGQMHIYYSIKKPEPEPEVNIEKQTTL